MKSTEKPHILFVIDRADWALGKLAREMMYALSSDFESKVVTAMDILNHPFHAWHESRKADHVHFLAPYLALGYSWLGVGRHSVVTLTHIEGPQDDMLRLGSFQYIAMSAVTAKAAQKMGLPVSFIVYPGVPIPDLPANKPDNETTVIGFSCKRSSDSQGRKGLDILVDVISHVSREIDIRMRITGEGMEMLVEQLRAGGTPVEYLGLLDSDDLAFFYHSVDVYISTSRLEGGPMPVLEAMAAGCCVLTTRVGFVPDVITSGVNGVICDVDDREGLILALKKICTDSNYRRLLGQRAKAHIRENWYWGHDRVKLVEAYTSIANNTPLTWTLPVMSTGITFVYATVATRLLGIMGR